MPITTFGRASSGAATLFSLSAQAQHLIHHPTLARYIGERRLAESTRGRAIGGLFAMQTIHKPDITGGG